MQYLQNSHISDLTSSLRRIRGPYLTLTRPSRHQQQRARQQSQQDEPLTDAQRSTFDAYTSQLISQLNAYITQLSDAENARASLRDTINDKKRNKLGLGALGRWAGGGAATAKSAEEEGEDAQEEALQLCRQEVIRYLRRRLEHAGAMQRGMVEIRLDREREKEASILYKAKGAAGSSAIPASAFAGADGVRTEELQRAVGESGAGAELSDEQLQLFEKENSTMLKHYTDQLDQVKNVQQTLYSISELQTQLAQNLVEQSENIELLVQDAHLTEENVTGGNKQLKKASERKSTAQMVFWSTCALCTTLVVWDLIF